MIQYYFGTFTIRNRPQSLWQTFNVWNNKYHCHQLQITNSVVVPLNLNHQTSKRHDCWIKLWHIANCSHSDLHLFYTSKILLLIVNYLRFWSKINLFLITALLVGWIFMLLISQNITWRLFVRVIIFSCLILVSTAYAYLFPFFSLNKGWPTYTVTYLGVCYSNALVNGSYAVLDASPFDFLSLQA